MIVLEVILAFLYVDTSLKSRCLNLTALKGFHLSQLQSVRDIVLIYIYQRLITVFYQCIVVNSTAGDTRRILPT